MKIYLTRDSVAAGDDVDAPHSKTFTLGDGMDFGGIIRAISSLKYLPSIGGGKATWTLSSAIPIAVFAQEWAEPKKVIPFHSSLKELDFVDNTLKLHFSYHAQTDPEFVFGVIKTLRLRAVE